MVTTLIVVAGIMLLGGLVLGFMVRGEVDERTGRRLERAQIKLTQLQAEQRIHAITVRAVGELLDAARRDHGRST